MLESICGHTLLVGCIGCPMDTAFIEDLTAFQLMSSNLLSVQSIGINLSLFLESSMMCLCRHGVVAAVLIYSS